MTTTSKKKKWNLLENCHKNALKLFCNLHIWQELEDLTFYGQWTNLYDLSQKWTKACDKCLNQFISDIHHTCEYEQHCNVGNTAKQSWLGLFQDSDFAGDLEDSKSTSGATLCIFRLHTFVPISWMCKKQTAVSHSLTESEIISLDAALRFDGILALELWDLIVSVFESVTQTSNRTERPVVSERSQKFSREDQRAEHNWLYSLERPVFASRSFIVCVLGQRSSDQDDYSRNESHNETCFQDQQSCTWLVVWWN